ncbi:YheT family hydrolase [Lutibacter sp.]|uniref:YheT family hydrolase n=1 Tax=Lutibacter sp. TaxID=1925666 RepID=UPI002733BFAA|nr:alpha/beta fold hydrolase [Lutibacter sp.]MDP3312613.1 alpha/beta fold hydrolase [Lutibacter sp.]
MPQLHSTYKPSLLFRSAHINTVHKTLFYNTTIIYQRKRIFTPDNDFLDLDFSFVNSETLVIVLHGLEGSSQSKYLLSTVRFLNDQKIDCLAVNFRGCSGEDNRHLYSYHSGKSDDLNVILDYILNHYTYKNIIFVGFSMGGNILLKFLGEGNQLNSSIKGGISISVPTDLAGSSHELSKIHNILYFKRFMVRLKIKLVKKITDFPQNNLNVNYIKKAKTFLEFDDAVTAPLNGFLNAEDYYTKSSSKQYIRAIRKPTLLINAQDDTFLSKSCFPFAEASNHPFFYFEAPKYGGHVGFNSSFIKTKNVWLENRILAFINQIL